MIQQEVLFLFLLVFFFSIVSLAYWKVSIKYEMSSNWLNFGRSWCTFFSYIEISNFKKLLLLLLYFYSREGNFGTVHVAVVVENKRIMPIGYSSGQWLQF